MSREGKGEKGQGGIALGCREGEVQTWQRRSGGGGVEEKKGEEGLIKG